MVFLSNETRKKYHRLVIDDYFDKYESHLYNGEDLRLAKNKFTNYYMKVIDWTNVYHCYFKEKEPRK